MFYFSYLISINLLVITIIILFFILEKHITALLIQLERISLFLIILMFFELGETRRKNVFIYVLFTVMVSEASMGLAILVARSRWGRKELTMFRV